MKQLFFAICLLAGFSLAAQSGSGFGIKGGLNFNSNGDLKFDQLPDISSDTQTGWHFGGFAKFGGDGLLYLRPEIVYTKLKSRYSYQGDERDFDMKKIDVPVLVGINILGPLHAFAGPSFQYVLDTDLEGISLQDVESDFTIGYNLGVGVNLGRLGVDLRYESGFSDNEADIIEDVSGELFNGRLETRPQQFILSLSYKLM